MRRWCLAAAVAPAMLCVLTAPAASAAPTAGSCLIAPSQVSSAVPWPQQRLDYQGAWPLTQGQGVTVAVIDSGVDASAPQLAGRVENGFDVQRGSGAANSDCLGHGTFVAGLIAARPRSGVGFAGVAPAAVILPIRQTDLGQDGTADGLAAGIRFATDHGASVINISLASTVSSAALDTAVAYAERHNVVIVAAAANDAQDGNPRTYPASIATVLAVGAVGQDDQRSSFSESGSFVGVAAPGSDIVGIGPRGPGQLTGSGTSYATGFVSGVAALVRAYRPHLTAAQVRHRIEVTADHPAGAVPNSQVGWGVVNPHAAVASELPEEGSQVPVAHSSAAQPAMPGRAEQPPLRPAVMAASGLALAAVAMVASLVIRRGHRRGWRPGQLGAADSRTSSSNGRHHAAQSG
jgi:membrane-anchored mycosin MYCP